MGKLSGATLVLGAALVIALPHLLTASWTGETLRSPARSFAAGKQALDLAIRTEDPARQTQLLCSALNEFGDAMLISPAEPRYQVAYADLLSELGNAATLCDRQNNFAPRAPEELLANALKLAPYSTVDRYLAAVAYIRKGDKRRGLALLKEAQELNPLLSEGQRLYAYNLVTNEEELKTALPQTYPLVALWVHDFYRTRRDDYHNWRPVFAGAVEHALDDLELRAREKRLADDKLLYAVKVLWLLPLTLHDDNLRRKLDLKYSALLMQSGEIEAGRFLELRAALTRVPVVKSSMTDKRPNTSMLADWVPDDSSTTASLGGVSQSIGFFRPDGFRVSTLVLEAQPGGEKISPSELQLLTSTDNFSYRPYIPEKPLRSFHLNGKQFVVIQMRDFDERYLKLRLPLIGKRGLPTDQLSALIQAYGERTQ